MKVNDIKQAVAFFKMLCQHGYSIYPAEADKPDGPYKIAKISTTLSPLATATTEAASWQDAIDQLKKDTNWKWDASPKTKSKFKSRPTQEVTQPEVVQSNKFKAIFMFDPGWGIQDIELGPLYSTCVEEGWFDKLMAEGVELAKKFITRQHPDLSWEKLQYQINVRPDRSPD